MSAEAKAPYAPAAHTFARAEILYRALVRDLAGAEGQIDAGELITVLECAVAMAAVDVFGTAPERMVAARTMLDSHVGELIGSLAEDIRRLGYCRWSCVSRAQ